MSIIRLDRQKMLFYRTISFMNGLLRTGDCSVVTTAYFVILNDFHGPKGTGNCKEDVTK